MLGRLHVTLIALSAAIVAVLLLLIIKRYCLPQKTRTTRLDAETGRNNDSLENGVARLHQVSPAHNNKNKDSAADSNNNNYALFKKAVSKRQGFSWADHPALVTEAVENGWSRFAFTTFVSLPTVNNKSRNLILSSPCVTGGSDPGDESNPEITWEICEGSSDYMQKIRLNPNLKNKTGAGLSAIRAGLPLPGPYLGNSSFPQEAYFEIKIVSFSGYDRSDEMMLAPENKLEGDKIKLIEEDFNKKTSPDSVIITASHSQRKKNKIIDDLKRGKLLQDEAAARVMLSVGLTCGGNSLPLKIPGTYQGSAGFSSSGSVYVNGTKLILESEANEWSEPDKVIGCGYNPSLKRVFFTVDSRLVHEIHCKTDEFTCPLYPVLASNVADTVISVNLGQSPFKYLPANLQRTPNPCFVMMNNSPSLGFIEDSKELFSMERIDSQGMQRRSNNNTVNSVRSLEYDVESEGDLFEIVLDHSSTVKSSPYNITTSSYNQ